MKQDHSDLIETIHAMRRQDEQVYKTQRGLYDSPFYSIDDDARCKIVDWCYNVIDMCKYSRDTVAIAVNILDRYAATQPIEFFDDQDGYILVTLVCLYTAIKIHEPIAMPPILMSQVGHGKFSPDLIVETERSILAAIGWRLNPPTATSFAENFLNLLPELQTPHDSILGLVRCQVESALKDSSFLGTHASHIAYAAVSNAILVLDPSVHLKACITMREATGVEGVSPDVGEKLSKACGMATIRPKAPVRRLSRQSSVSSIHVSPRSVIMERS